jgi:osmotically-inducible protein OsmY
MPNRAPKSYDDIVRATVPEPDSSWRPSKAQEKLAYEGYRALDAYEHELSQRVHAALVASGLDASGLQIEIDRDRVTLRGHVRDYEAMLRIPQIVGQVEGVSSVLDQLVIAP